MAGSTTLNRNRGFTSGANRHPAFVTPLKDRLELRIDPDWPRRKLWLGLQNNTIGDKLVFTFFDFEEGIQEQAAVNYADIDVIGRAEVYKNFVGVSNREFSLNFKFQAQGVTSGNLVDVLDAEVVQPAKWIDALKYPITDQAGISHAPPPCLLQIGQLFHGRVIVTDASITWQHPFDPDTLMPYAAEVSTTLTVVRRRIQNYNFSRGRR